MDNTPTHIKVQELDIACWTLPKDLQARLLNLGTFDNPQMIKLNATLDELIVTNTKTLLQEYKDIFAQNCTNLKGIPSCIIQHCIELDITISPTHQIRYHMNLNYVVIIKQDLDKLLNAGFITPVEEASWLWPIIVVPKKTINFESELIFDDSMLQPRKIHILYVLLKRFQMKQWITKSIHFWMDFVVITRS